MMRKKQIMKHIDIAIGNVNKEIQFNTDRGGVFARGLAGEGYHGGYRDALRDVVLLLNDVIPNRDYWRDEEAE